MVLRSAVLRTRSRRVFLVLLGALFLSALVASPVQAYTVQGGTEAQRAYVSQVVDGCALPASYTDAELQACGPVKIVLTEMKDVSAYSKIGVIYLNSAVPPGQVLGELVVHEWSHQIWYTLGPKWWQKWAGLCDPDGKACADSWRLSVAENFAECAKMTLWGSEHRLRDYACTDLAVVDPATLRNWLAVARYAKKCPLRDLNPTAMPSSETEDELVAAADYVYSLGIMQGFTDTTFRAGISLTKRQLAAICERSGLSCPAAWRCDDSAATRREVRDSIPGLAWTASDWTAPLTRGQLARLLWRAR